MWNSECQSTDEAINAGLKPTDRVHDCSLSQTGAEDDTVRPHRFQQARVQTAIPAKLDAIGAKVTTSASRHGSMLPVRPDRVVWQLPSWLRRASRACGAEM
jgi:hypothetical protein